MSAIAELVTLLLSTGIPPESISAAVELAQRHHAEQVEIHRNSTGIPPETTAERRKAWDRERKRKNAETKNVDILTSLSSSLLSEETLKKERKKESSGIRARARKRLGPLPDGWHPNDDAYRLAKELGVDLGPIENRFRDYLKSHGKQYADYDAALRTFINNTPKFNGQPQGQGNGRRTVHDAAKDLHEDLLRRAAQFDEPAPSRLCSGEGTNALRLIPPRGRQ